MTLNPIIRRRLVLAGLSAATAGGLAGVATALPIDTCSPDERIDAAIETIRQAMAEKYPGWRPQVENTAQRCLRTVDGKLVPAEVNRHAVLIFTADESQYPQRGRWFVDYTEHRNA